MATISIPYLHIDIDVQPDEHGKLAIDFRTFPRGATPGEVIDALHALLAHLETPPAAPVAATVPSAIALDAPPPAPPFIGRDDPTPEPQAEPTSQE